MSPTLSGGFLTTGPQGMSPVLNLEIGCIGKWSANGTYEVILDGLNDLARIMDEKELNSFVSLWQKYHSEGE